jgi:metallophosphoesterase superfamily enzyme
MTAFLLAHADIELHLVLGNHDRWMETVHLPGQVHREFSIGEVSLRHDPSECSGPSIAGHLHPGCRVPTGARSSAMLPCFWQSGSCLVLPAFGEFTGFSHIKPNPGDRAYVIAGKSVCEIPV